MKTLRVTWKGISPLIMHSCQCVNPLHPISKELKKYTSKKSKDKTDEDLVKISDIPVGFISIRNYLSGSF